MKTSSTDTVTLGKSEFKLTLGNTVYQILIELKILKGVSLPYFNATNIVKQYNTKNGTSKRLSDFIKSKRYREMMKNLLAERSLTKNKLCFTKGKTSNPVTWVHKDLFLALMIWLGSENELVVSEFLTKVLKNLDTARLTRDVSKVLNKPMTDQIKRLIVMLEREGAYSKYYYSTINDQIYKSATGRPAKNKREVHDNLIASDNLAIAETRANVQAFIKDALDNGATAWDTKDNVKAFLHRIGKKELTL